MAGLTILFTVLCMALIMVLSVPASYRLSFSIREKTGYFLFSWWGKGLYADIRWKAGEPVRRTVYYLWKNQTQLRNYERWLAQEVSRETDSRELPSDVPDGGVTYEELEKEWNEQPQIPAETDVIANDLPLVEEEEKKISFEKMEAAKAVVSWIRAVFRHSWIREFSLQGVLGFSQPYYMGMAAAVGYACFPEYMGRIRFSFTEAVCDIDGRAKGRIIPLVLAGYTLRLLACRSVRAALLWLIRKRKGGF